MFFTKFLLTVSCLVGIIIAWPSLASAVDDFYPEQRWGTDTNNYWEPTIAADPSPGSSMVYQLTTDLSKKQILFRSSSDGGYTWSSSIQVCVYPGTAWQYDPQIKVANGGVIYVVCLNNYDKPGVVFTKSHNFGESWTYPIPLDGQLGYSDKPELLVSPSGEDVYVAFNSKQNLYVAESHNSGDTFTDPVLATNEKLWYYPYGGAIAPNGTVYFAVAGESGSATDVNKQTGPSRIELVSSSYLSKTWTTTYFDTGQAGEPCQGPHCYPDFFAPQDAIAIDSTGKMVFVYTRNDTPLGPASLYLSRSTDGKKWTTPVLFDSQCNNACNNTSPALEVGPMPGDFRIVWQDNRNGPTAPTAWNTWYARSMNQGQTWSEVTRISNLDTGANYKTIGQYGGGYQFPYGDYLGFSVDSSGVNHVIWGEGTGIYTGGGTWYTRD
jgi:hypothetical protein